MRGTSTFSTRSVPGGVHSYLDAEQGWVYLSFLPTFPPMPHACLFSWLSVMPPLIPTNYATLPLTGPWFPGWFWHDGVFNTLNQTKGTEDSP